MTSKVSLQNASGSHRHASLEQYERSTADLYITPAESVQRLYKARPELLTTVVWDSSAGLGHICKAVRDMGGQCIGTELNDHPFPKVAHIITGRDLFTTDVAPALTCVVNPPYRDAHRHIEHMLKLGCEVFGILRLNWVAAKKRAHLLRHLREILLVGRQGMLPPGVEDRGLNPAVDFAFFHFTPERKADHAIILERI